MGYKINRNAQADGVIWWSVKAQAWTVWKDATRYPTEARAERAFNALDASGMKPCGVFPTSAGCPAWAIPRA